MACGTPVIAFPRGSMKEILRHGRTGFLVPDVDAAVAAVARLGEIRREACRQWVEERFTADRMAEDYLSVYRTVLHRWPLARASRREPALAGGEEP
jgi:glycosyltransferase involved in cell wall biosynthesis